MLLNEMKLIFLPELKKFFLSGLSLEEASILIKETVKSSFIGVESFYYFNEC